MAISLDKIKSSSPRYNKSEKLNVSFISVLSKNFFIFNQLKQKDKRTFYEELDLLLGAGLDLEKSLMLIESQSKNKTRKKALTKQLIENIISGLSLSESMQKSKQFSNYEFYSIQIGEETGKLKEVIRNLKSFYDNLLEQKKKMTSALSYPIIVLIVALSAVFFLLHFVVPLFEDVFKRFDGEIPAITQFIINWSDNLPTMFLWTFSVISILILSYYLNRKNEKVRLFVSRVMLSIPYVGDLIKKIFLARIFNSLSLLVSSKNPLLHSISMIQKMINFFPFEQSLKRIENDILNGMALHQSLELDDLYDKQTVTLIKVAEEVGQLEEVLQRISQNLAKEINHKLSIIGTLLEPILIVVVGGIVALILVAMYLPLFNLSTSIY